MTSTVRIKQLCEVRDKLLLTTNGQEFFAEAKRCSNFTSSLKRHLACIADTNAVPCGFTFDKESQVPRSHHKRMAHVLPTSGSMQRDDGRASPSPSSLLLLDGRLFHRVQARGLQGQSEVIREKFDGRLDLWVSSLTTIFAN